MAISQQYITLVNQLRTVDSRFDDISAAWDNVITAYTKPDHIGEDEEQALFDLANVCAGAYMRLTNFQVRVQNILAELHHKKNAGDSGKHSDPWHNFKQAEKLFLSAYQGVLLRMSDKHERYKNISAAPELEQCNEALEDTLLDLCSYALIAICLLREEVTACME